MELEVPLFQLLRQLVPANSHLSIAYETELHRDTQVGLMSGVPPVATPLGWAAWSAGFNGGFKDWHISEGGHEGPKKLQANVPLDCRHASQAAAEALEACRHYQARQPKESPEDPQGMPGLWAATNRRLAQVIEALSGDSSTH
ncbi:MAG: DUF1122 family protein [Acidobacteriota bacterium]